ncbi:acyl-CoA thioesterase [Pandoraea norimbergensis]|uniref:Thioesterase n=2 Tax=Pandoraea TaxID=93217 RepID=A0ABM5WRM8_9BURK|nr:acyl-CoA thioesterase [Pandoraea norimbergensis]ALS63353.1 thioesterase [Pandoraea norimbergensis]
MSMPIRWGDMDAFGHVNNTVYFRYMEQVRISWLETLDVASEERSAGEGPVIINAHMTFLKQLRYPGDIDCRMFIGEPGRTSVDTRFELRRADTPDVIAAEGGAKIVWVNYLEEKSVPLPASIRALVA